MSRVDTSVTFDKLPNVSLTQNFSPKISSDWKDQIAEGGGSGHALLDKQISPRV